MAATVFSCVHVRDCVETMARRFLRLKVVMHKTGRSRTGILHDIPDFPAGVLASKRLRVWVEEGVEDWMQRRIETARGKVTHPAAATAARQDKARLRREAKAKRQARHAKRLMSTGKAMLASEWRQASVADVQWSWLNDRFQIVSAVPGCPWGHLSRPS